MIFLEADLSQSESRIVFALTGDPELARLATLPSWEYDGHTENIVVVGLANTLDEALALKKVDPAEFAKRRHIGKIVSHGCQRDMKGATLAKTLLLNGFATTEEKCERMVSAYHAKRPAIRDWFREIRKQVMRDKMLVNSWGRRWDLRYDRLDDELFRQAYSFLSQSENADLLNQWGLKPTYHYMKSLLGYPPNVQVHDSLLCSVPPDLAYDVACFIAESLERPRLYGGNLLAIPVEFKLGINWGADEKTDEGVSYKRLPGRIEFTEAAYYYNEKRRELDREVEGA